MFLVNPYIYGAELPFDYANPGGTGNRLAAGMNVTANFSPSNGTLTNIINGNFSANNTGSFRFPLGGSGRSFDVDFSYLGYLIECDQVRFYNSSGTSQGTWSAYAVLSGTPTLVEAGWGFAGSFDLNLSVISACDTLRFTQTSGVTNGSPWFEEIEFRLRQA